MILSCFFFVESSDLERNLYLAGQNLSKTIVEKIKKELEEIYQTDEYFLDEVETILAPYWEELTDEEISQILIESFQTFDSEQQNFIEKQDLIRYLTSFGDMPLTNKDFQIMFSLIKTSNRFDYQQFVTKLCSLEKKKKKKKKKKKSKKKTKRTIT
ncbi:hypothetical protein I4U23_029051 [Adineta vaga]|nr:hypothetical protein I4U23_029051 [Adineta vaga]